MKKSKYHKIDSFTPRIVVLKFFASGGYINYQEAKNRTGLKHTDLLGFVSRKGISYHTLIERCIEETYQDIDSIDFSNEIDEIVAGGKKAVYDELKKYLPEEAAPVNYIKNFVKRINTLANGRPHQRTSEASGKKPCIKKVS